jgi:hypothetical protein
VHFDRACVRVTDDEAIPIVNMAFSIQYHFTNLPHQDQSQSFHVAKSPATAYNFEDTYDGLGDYVDETLGGAGLGITL